MNPEQQMGKLLELMAVVNKENARSADVEKLFGAALTAIDAVKTDLTKSLKQNEVLSSATAQSFKSDLQVIAQALKMLEKRIGISETTAGNSLTKLSKEVAASLKELRSLIPMATNLEPLKRQIEAVERKIPTIPPPQKFIPDTGLEIVEKINDLPTDKDKFKIDAKHIKNLPKVPNISGFGGPGGVGGGNLQGLEGSHNIIVENSQYPGYKKLRLKPKITVSDVEPIDPDIGDLWVDTA